MAFILAANAFLPLSGLSGPCELLIEVLGMSKGLMNQRDRLSARQSIKERVRLRLKSIVPSAIKQSGLVNFSRTRLMIATTITFIFGMLLTHRLH